MGYIPGSHLGGEEFINVFTEPGAWRAFEKRQTRPAVFVHCRPGDVIFHHAFTVHCARPNRSTRTRKVHTAIYFRDGCKRANARAHHSLDRDGIAVGAVIDGLATPIAWPVSVGWKAKPAPFPGADDHPALGRATKIGIFPNNEVRRGRQGPRRPRM